jgi:hypothetical protein
MDVSVFVPARTSDEPQLAACLAGILAQRDESPDMEVFVVQYSGGDPLKLSLPLMRHVRLISVDHPSPYAARNFAASQATGEIFLFTEPGCVAEPGWVAAHVAHIRGSAVTVSVGRVAPARATRFVDLFSSYEDIRDEWVFSQPCWQHYFGRPKNMAVARRRFETHGPFVEVARGADSTFVQRVAREVSCEEVGLAPDAVVRQQSIRDLPSCLRDRFDHSYALQLHRSAHAAPIALGDRIRLLRQTVRERRYGPLDAATLLMVLGAGIAVFRVGGWRGAAARKPHA